MPPSSKEKRGSNEFFTDEKYFPNHFSEDEYNEYKKEQVFNPSTPRVLAFLVFSFGIIGAVHGLLELIDAHVIHGVRYISHCVLAYIVLHFCWLWIVCRITLWRTSKRGIQVVERWPSLHEPAADAIQNNPTSCPLLSARSSQTENPPPAPSPIKTAPTAESIETLGSFFRPLQHRRQAPCSCITNACGQPCIGIHAQLPARCAAHAV